MGYIQAKCSNCGAQLEINEEKGKGYCPHCGALFVAEKVVTKEVFTQNITKNIYGREKTEAEEYIKNGDVFIQLNEYAKAKNAFDKAIELNPADWRGWFGMVRVKTKNLTDYFDSTHISDLEKAHSVASDEEDEEINKLYKQYEDTKKALEKLHENKSVDNFYDSVAPVAAAVDTSAVAVPPRAVTPPKPATVAPPRYSSKGFDAATIKKKKRKHTRKAFITILIIAIVIGVFSGVTGKVGLFKVTYDYAIVNDCVTITGIHNVLNRKNIEIPNNIDGHPVTRISRNVFSCNDKIESVTIPETVTYIDAYAFFDCNNLEYVRFKSGSPAHIGNYVFYGNSGNQNRKLDVKIYVPSNSLNAYYLDYEWIEYYDMLSGWQG